MDAKRKSVYDLQTKLGVISDDNPDIPYVYSDGIFGGETTASVEAFQDFYGLESTGVVDYATWRRINEVYEYVAAKSGPSAPIYPFRQTLLGGSVNPGDKSELVYIVQSMLEKLKLTYDIFDGVTINGLYDENTSEAIERFQELHGLPATGKTDRATWNMLAAAYNTREFEQ